MPGLHYPGPRHRTGGGSINRARSEQGRRSHQTSLSCQLHPLTPPAHLGSRLSRTASYTREIRHENSRASESERRGGRGTSGAMLDHLVGLVKVRVVRGVNLAIRDLCSSDPYVVVRMGKQKLKTRVIKRSTNPEWNEELTLSIEDPAVPIILEVYDKDTFIDDSMGNAELDIRPLVEVVKMRLQDVADNTAIKKLVPNRQNCLAEESTIFIAERKVKQDLVVRLKNVECGEIELQLQWVDVPGSRGV